MSAGATTARPNASPDLDAWLLSRFGMAAAASIRLDLPDGVIESVSPPAPAMHCFRADFLERR